MHLRIALIALLAHVAGKDWAALCCCRASHTQLPPQCEPTLVPSDRVHVCQLLRLTILTFSFQPRRGETDCLRLVMLRLIRLAAAAPPLAMTAFIQDVTTVDWFPPVVSRVRPESISAPPDPVGLGVVACPSFPRFEHSLTLVVRIHVRA